MFKWAAVAVVIHAGRMLEQIGDDVASRARISRGRLPPISVPALAFSDRASSPSSAAALGLSGPSAL